MKRGWFALAFVGVTTTSACRPKVLAVIETEPAGAEPVAIVEAPSQRVTTTCTARTPAGAPLLIPNAAEWLVHMSPGSVMRSPAYALFAASIEQGSEWATVSGVFATCGYAVDRIEHALVGFNAQEEFVGILIAPGIGQPELARCLVMQVQTANGDPALADVVPLPSDPNVGMIDFTDGRAYMFDENMIVLATSAWQSEVEQLASCAVTPAVHGSLAGPIADLDVNAPMWVVGSPQAEVLAPIADMITIDADAIRSFSVSVRLEDGAALTTRLQMTEAAVASHTATSLRSAVQSLSAMVPPPLSAVPSSIVIESTGADVRLDLSLHLDELRYLASL